MQNKECRRASTIVVTCHVENVCSTKSMFCAKMLAYLRRFVVIKNARVYVLKILKHVSKKSFSMGPSLCGILRNGRAEVLAKKIAMVVQNPMVVQNDFLLNKA